METELQMFKMILTAAAMAVLFTAATSPVQAAEGDAARGKKLFVQCGYCHGVQGQGGPLGPTLKGIVGRKAAQAPGFTYSAPMKASGLTWTEANLGAFITAPQAKVKGTRMVFAGFKKPTDVDDVITYLKTVK